MSAAMDLITLPLPYIAAFILGALAGALELANRYKDAPFKVLLKKAGVMYWTINGLASVLGLYLIIVFELNVLDGVDPEAQLVADVLLAGLGSMLVFRSSVLNIKHNSGSGEEMPIGPNLIVLKLLQLIDREVDRERAKDRTNSVIEMCQDLTFNDMNLVISKPSEFVMQNLEVAEWDKVQNITKIVGKYVDGTPEEVKAQIIALHIYDLLGEDALKNLVALQRQRKLIGPERSTSMPVTGTLEDSLNDPDLISGLFEASEMDVSEEAISDERMPEDSPLGGDDSQPPPG